ncbi:RNA binding S1 [Bosea sp. LC85]|uniref:Tex family protein n=1 Tax=Bosea sp. LC85 TaxID=1502851 RepID=UPI0004E3FE6D|nr:Tex family protein [Bosea sp. LC85]KFC64971.1 RNA binding S1 [Bosea sp. LC85]
MSDNSAIASRIAAEIGARLPQAAAAIALIDEGATIPFIARYRKEATGGLDDTQLRQLGERLIYLRELEGRRGTILEAIRQQEKLTLELEASIAAATTKAELEDIYLPFKPKRRNRAEIARERGLGPLADAILADRKAVPAELAAAYLTDDVPETKSALEGARDILSEQFAQNAELLGRLRGYLRQKADLRAKVIEGKEEAGAKFSDYFDHTERWANVPSHRALAMLRGRNEDILTLDIEADKADPRPVKPVMRMIAETYAIGESLPGDAWLMEVVGWTWRVKLSLHLSVDLMTDLRMKAEAEAINVFARNLKNLLLAAPAGSRATMGLDPGIRTGVKVAVVDGTGKLLATTTVYPFQPRNDVRGTQAELASLIRRHGVELVAIGNGTGSRETEKLVAEMLGDLPPPKPIKVVVSEAGASVYSASERAAAEFPGLDVTLRGAVSIARRLQDPLAELVKIDPKSIGVGQYQHDVDQYHLARALDAMVEDAVNAVGVDLNTASASLLARVSGLGAALAEAIVAHRDANGPFGTRRQLLAVARLGPRTFEQCAGFLRIRDGSEPLDASSVHPEAYGVARKIVAACGRDLRSLMGDSAELSRLDPRAFVDDRFGLPTVRDIIAELDKPGRDPRPAFKTAAFADGVDDMKDLETGMMLEGTVTNVAAFGAFVDIGVHQDGLVHVSQLAERFVRDAHEVVKVGDVVKVRVLEVDIKRKRISLSMRSDAGSEASKGQRENGRNDARAGKGNVGRAGPPRTPQKETQGALGAALMDALKRR